MGWSFCLICSADHRCLHVLAHAFPPRRASDLGTLCALYLLRRPLSRLPSSTLAWACLGLLLAMTLLVASAAWALFDLSVEPEQGALPFMLRMLDRKSTRLNSSH